MVFTVSLRNLSFKQDIHNLDAMINDQKSTYVILKYASDIPDIYYVDALEDLSDFYNEITYEKLRKLVFDYMRYPVELELE